MERNLAAEIDALKQEMKEIQEILQSCIAKPNAQDDPDQRIPPLPDCAKGGPNPFVGHVEKMPQIHPVPEINTLLNQLENSCGHSGSTGRITYLGVFASGGRQSTWVKNDINTDNLLTLIEKRTAEKVLNCIGSNDRLNLLLAILRKPRTVAELVSDCGYSSTGQVYHHLKPLLAADLVTQDKRGSYVIQPHRVQGMIMLLAGIADLVDGTYTQGEMR